MISVMVSVPLILFPQHPLVDLRFHPIQRRFGLGAAGGAEAVVCVLALRDSIAPPTIGLQEPDPECDLNYVPLEAQKQEFDVALSSSLGFGGHNACLAFRKIGGGRDA